MSDGKKHTKIESAETLIAGCLCLGILTVFAVIRAADRFSNDTAITNEGNGVYRY